jgi:Tfp pilus assembly protein PilF
MKKLFLLLAILAVTAFYGCSSKTDTIPGQIKPGSAEYIMNEGIFYLNEGRIELAEKRLLQALKKKPSLVRALNSLGIVYTYNRQFSEAIDYFKRVLAINPQFIDAYNSLGLIYSEMKQYDLAKENLLVAANSEHYRTPENAFVNLALLELKYDRLNAAMRYLEKGIQKNRSFAPLYNLTGFVLEKQGKYKEALSSYDKAQSLLVEPNIDILVNLGRIHSKMGNKGKALDTLEQALGLATNPAVRNQVLEMIKALR